MSRLIQSDPFFYIYYVSQSFAYIAATLIYRVLCILKSNGDSLAYCNNENILWVWQRWHYIGICGDPHSQSTAQVSSIKEQKEPRDRPSGKNEKYCQDHRSRGADLPGIQPMRHLIRGDRSAREAGKYRIESTRRTGWQARIRTWEMDRKKLWNWSWRYLWSQEARREVERAASEG